MDRNYLYTLTSALLFLPIVISLCKDLNCDVCNNGGNNCDKCKQGFTVTSNGCYQCPTNCLTCTAAGYCQSCSPGFRGSQCLYTCNDNCNEAGCEMVSGYCLKCKNGWYGPQCQQECKRCENELCDLRNCSTGCTDGYVQEIYNDLSNCITCPLFCTKCTNASFCTQCYSGHYIYQYTAPAGIVASCLNCDTMVPRCVDCTYDQNQVFCRRCEEGYVVNQDNQCVTTVVCIHCRNGCDSAGLCFDGCQPGWSGQRCNYMCNYGCETCINNYACESCVDGFYTQMCSVSCNTNCLTGSYPRCRFSDGYCSNGCNKGFWGDQCENSCNSNCLDISTASELCHRNGTCYYGCKAGYLGSNCSQVFSSTSPSPISSTTNLRISTDERSIIVSLTTTLRTSTEEKSLVSPTIIILTSTDKSTQISVPTHVATDQSTAAVTNEQPNNKLPVAAIGGGAGGGGAALAAVVVVAVVICFLKRRMRQCRAKSTKCGTTN